MDAPCSPDGMPDSDHACPLKTSPSRRSSKHGVIVPSAVNIQGIVAYILKTYYRVHTTAVQRENDMSHFANLSIIICMYIHVLVSGNSKNWLIQS